MQKIVEKLKKKKLQIVNSSNSIKNKVENLKFWNFYNENESEGVLELEGDIASQSWWGDEVTPNKFKADLKALGEVDKITVRINSAGGDVFAANSIYTALKQHKAYITVEITGWAMSAATIICMAADKIKITPGGIFMIHDPLIGCFGMYNIEDIRSQLEILETVKECIINVYMTRTSKTREELSEIMSNEKWYPAKEAKENGFIDEILFEEVEENMILDNNMMIINGVSCDITKLKNFPINKFKAHFRGEENSQKDEPFNMQQNKKGGQEMAIKNSLELRNAYPEFVNQIVEEEKEKAVKAAVEEERERIKNIERISNVGFEQLVNKAKFEEPVDAKELSFQMLLLQQEAGKNYLENRQVDYQNSGIEDLNNVPAPEKNNGKGVDESLMAKVFGSKRRTR